MRQLQGASKFLWPRILLDVAPMVDVPCVSSQGAPTATGART